MQTMNRPRAILSGGKNRKKYLWKTHSGANLRTQAPEVTA